MSTVQPYDVPSIKPADPQEPMTPSPDPVSANEHAARTVADTHFPLAPEHIQQLVTAKTQTKKVRRAISMALLNGWGTAVFAVLTGLSGMFSLSTLLLGAGMGVIAYFEFTGAAQLRRFNPSASRRLGFNQIGFGALLIAYGVWQIVVTVSGPGPFAQYHSAGPDVANLLGPWEDMMRVVMLAVYGALIACGALIQGGTAVYYFSRRKHIEAYIQDTPEWIVQLQRSGVLN